MKDYDAGFCEIEFSNKQLITKDAVEALQRIDETSALTGATPKGGLVKCRDILPVERQRMTEGGLIATYLFKNKPFDNAFIGGYMILRVKIREDSFKS